MILKTQTSMKINIHLKHYIILMMNTADDNMNISNDPQDHFNCSAHELNETWQAVINGMFQKGKLH